MPFVDQDTFKSLVEENPCPFARIYWGSEPVSPLYVRHNVHNLQGHERLLILGRFAYVEAPRPGMHEQRHMATTPPAVPHSVLRLADIWSRRDVVVELERRVMLALSHHVMPTYGKNLIRHTELPRCIVEAICYSCEARGIVQVYHPTHVSETGEPDLLVQKIHYPAAWPNQVEYAPRRHTSAAPTINVAHDNRQAPLLGLSLLMSACR